MMHISKSNSYVVPILASLLWLGASVTAAETIVIKASSLLDFEPGTLNASVGDVLEFHFFPFNHSVVMGDLAHACQPAASGGFYSGFLPVSSGENAEVFQVTINDTNPIVYYSSQNEYGHNQCRDGMYGFVNQGNQSAIDEYHKAAKGVDTNVSPDGGPFGGVLAANPNATAVVNSTTSNSPSTTTATASATASWADAVVTGRRTIVVALMMVGVAMLLMTA